MANAKERSRRPWGSLTREAVIDAALEIVDREGLEALSMPRLAKELGTGVMTLYGHIENKADLVDALAERVLAGIESPADDTGGWAEHLGDGMRHLRAAILRHPALGAVLTARGVTTPSVFRHLEGSLRVLRSAGFEPKTSVEVYYALFTYTLGFLAWEIPRVHRQQPSDYARQWADALASLPTDDYPTLHQLADELPNATSDQQFETGLDALLRGFRASLPPTPRAKRPSRTA